MPVAMAVRNGMTIGGDAAQDARAVLQKVRATRIGFIHIINMTSIESIPVPPDSLLAQFGPAHASRDCFARTVPGTVSLTDFVERFYCSWVFRPERLALGLIGHGASNADARQLAHGKAQRFSAWNVIERRDTEILLQDVLGATASWLAVQYHGETTTLLFGSWVGKPSQNRSRILGPFHRWYSRVLLGGV
ncbi:hypothetical protein [Alterisphingorhabdus coralli]|uniref:Uncharacterized protein n=1 Tax=Alterisphingorhabdus coralli TaxID=3071408 RepID=A0AA97F861_9SPHN|nr:hypothetical protein [Parasphingorhabdus sp. SCSIO 66989]WOE75261.1 hypothetical protein RB602_00645 [Parasphingorhabdus sp. SCSIO 66989]